MKFNCGESWEAYYERVENWHPWFAWRPVRVVDHDCRWLEAVERKLTYGQFSVLREYRPAALTQTRSEGE